MYTPTYPNSLRVTYRVPEPVPRTEENCEPGDYGLKLLYAVLMSLNFKALSLNFILSTATLNDI